MRELIYDFRDWQTIEATGKGGDDDGFDIRAYERTTTTVVDDDGNEVVRPMDGNLWMIQCKREKTIPPSKIKKILEDIDPENPPYLQRMSGLIGCAAAKCKQVERLEWAGGTSWANGNEGLENPLPGCSFRPQGMSAL